MTELFSSPRLRSFLSLLVVLVGGFVPLSARGEDFTREQLDFFENEVRPILVANCQECHGVKTQESNLRLDSRAAALEGGEMGPAVVPGQPDDSLLMLAVRYQELEMPPENPLSDEEIATLERWIRMKAPWPDEEAAPALGDQQRIFEVAKEHWSFQPLANPEVPQVQNRSWVKTPVDAFVLARLEQTGLTPSPPAEKREIIRRLSLDLTGLLPTPDEVDAFVSDESPTATAELIDRLLDSPHYGERWGRLWLDVARYADTRDWFPQVDTRYPYAYTYRDWVIDAFNRDLPYDAFIRYQIAADAYVTDADDPDLAALGFLTVGPRFRNNVHEQVDDRIDVVTRGLLAMTTSCARCHDHKYDPIPTADYYSLYGVFASSSVPDEFPKIRLATVTESQREDYERQLAERQAEFDEYIQSLVTEAEQDLRQRMADYLVGYYEMNITKKESIRSLLSKRELKETAMTPLANGLDRLTKEKQFQNHPVMRPWALLMPVPDPKFPAALTRLLAEEGPLHPSLAKALKETPPANRLELLQLYGGLFDRALDSSAGSSANSEAEDLSAFREFLEWKQSPFQLRTGAVVNASRLLGAGRLKLAKYENALLDLEINHPGAPARAMVIEDRTRPVAARIFRRGDPAQRGDVVPRRFLSILAGPEAPEFPKDSSGRQQLAEAIADPANPLTARVWVNRVWMHHFGAALVSTPGDFGLRSDLPSHPQLLDWLAGYLIEHNWSTKQLHRVILLSSTWQQTVAHDEQKAKVDPENRLLWRANRRRLDFEQMRDAMLVVSGRLDRSVGGRPVVLTEQPFPTRRTVYGHVDRVNLDPLFTTFDFATPDSSKPERAETLVPQQSLFQMNHEFVLEQARHLTESDAFQDLAGDEQRVAHLYRRIYARQPTPAETAATTRFVTAASRLPTPRPEAWKYGYGSYDPQQKAVTFQELPYFDGRRYQGSETYPDPELRFLRLDATGGQAGPAVDRASIRRWVAPVDAQVRMTGTLKHDRDQGDGVRGRVLVAGRQVGEWRVFNEAVSTDVEEIQVKAGETIDFMVDCFGNGSNDTYLWAPVIHFVQTPPGVQVRKFYHAERNFGAPEPAPLTPWQQVAHALMLTNEFMFID